MGTLWRVTSWIEIGLGALITALAVFGIYGSWQIAPYDEQHGVACFFCRPSWSRP